MPIVLSAGGTESASATLICIQDALNAAPIPAMCRSLNRRYPIMSVSFGRLCRIEPGRDA
jgi:hypothetical protein